MYTEVLPFICLLKPSGKDLQIKVNQSLHLPLWDDWDFIVQVYITVSFAGIYLW